MATRANLPESAVLNFERGEGVLKPGKLIALRDALERGGVEFIDGERVSVRLRGAQARHEAKRRLVADLGARRSGPLLVRLVPVWSGPAVFLMRRSSAAQDCTASILLRGGRMREIPFRPISLILSV